ncbi:MAG: GNAT family N-acetyltransferase [Clostridia bacterium]|nr:GNAT family N-acetyltransferase [Clostridia bacterium]
MELICITRENLAREHICCAISNDRDVQVRSKKAWLLERLDEGLVFLKGNVRGKCFIEYIPAENAWAPIEAESYMYIDCLWVSGQHKGRGYSSQLLNACIEDSRAKGRRGLAILSSQRKMGFLADPGYLKYQGFQPADTAGPYFMLMYLPFEAAADKPRFRRSVRETDGMPEGFVLYYTDQCPFTARYAPLLEAMAKARGLDFQALHIRTREAAQNAPTPFTAFSLFYQGAFVTHEILSEKKFEKILAERGL